MYRDDYIAKCAGLGYDPEMLALRELYGRGSVLFELGSRSVSVLKLLREKDRPFSSLARLITTIRVSFVRCVFLAQ